MPELGIDNRQPAVSAVEDIHGSTAEILARDSESQVVPAVSIKVSRGEGCAELVTRLDCLRHACNILMPELVDSRREGI